MKNLLKFLGITALAVGLTPYRVETDEETGDKTIQALFWKATYGNRPENQGLSLDFGFFSPMEQKEPHLYADELVVHYHNGQPCCADEEPCCTDSASCTQEDGPYACCKACQESREASEEQPAEDQGGDEEPQTAPVQPEEP